MSRRTVAAAGGAACAALLATALTVPATATPSADTPRGGTPAAKSDDRFDFTFKDVDGNDVSLSDERFRDKVVVVTLGGTWCPNCHDEAAFLVPFYREHQAQGFEVIALMFERHGEFDKAANAVRGFRRDLDIPYTTLIAGVADDEDPERKLPNLSGVYGYPTAIFVDRSGHIRKIHTGFSGPATGKHYEEQIAGFRALVDELLNLLHLGLRGQCDLVIAGDLLFTEERNPQSVQRITRCRAVHDRAEPAETQHRRGDGAHHGD